jgi:hypothetical protein
MRMRIACSSLSCGMVAHALNVWYRDVNIGKSPTGHGRLETYDW